MELSITIEVWQKGDWYVAKSPELDFISQGRNMVEAKKNLIEVIQIQFEEMKESETLDDYLAECGYEIKSDKIIPHTDMIGFEKHLVQVV